MTYINVYYALAVTKCFRSDSRHRSCEIVPNQSWTGFGLISPCGYLEEIHRSGQSPTTFCANVMFQASSAMNTIFRKFPK